MRDAPAGHRVAVTGLGVLCSLGRGVDAVWEAIASGRRGFGAVTLFDTSGVPAVPVAGVKEIPAETRVPGRTRIEKFLFAAADEAAASAGLTGSDALGGFGVAIGTSNGGMLEAETWYERRFVERSAGRRVAPSAGPALRLPGSALTDAMAARFSLRGPRLTNTTACSSSAGAIASAAARVRDGDAAGMIAGGGDSLCRLTYSGFGSLRLMDPVGCRPFDRSRRGLTLGEGAGILVLEAWAHARARGVRPLAEILDHGATCDAHHMTASHPEGRGMAAAMREALARAGVGAHSIACVNAHGTATPVNDAAEARAIEEVFGAPPRPAVSSTKSMHGHLLGGSGAVEAVITILSILNGAVPATAGLEDPEGLGGVDLVAGSARPATIGFALSNSFGFGGGNVVLLFASAREGA
ncbi:MAG: beta-ketoacyl-[acyl-carrier-protein] synthase family protein [Acidobacteria bacterium]|nr:beta-ketoacyl-[acyl-carrier-protein] synthase family protein [Acidobacteriota bacterium]